MIELKNWVAAPSFYWEQGKEHFFSWGLSITEYRIHQEHKDGRWSELTFIVLVLIPLVSFLLSLSVSLSFLPSSLSFFQYIFFCTHSTPQMIWMQQSHTLGQGPQGLTTGHQGCQLGELSHWGCDYMWKAGALHPSTWAGMCFCCMLQVSHLGPISRV